MFRVQESGIAGLISIGHRVYCVASLRIGIQGFEDASPAKCWGLKFEITGTIAVDIYSNLTQVGFLKGAPCVSF